jgi:hypothetical protein
MAQKFWQSPKRSAKKKTSTKSFYSSYWLGNMSKGNYRSMFDTDAPVSKSKYDIFRLVELRQAVSNFVRILTQRGDIKVVYNEKNTNATNGNVITISPDLDGEEFDVAVGLALHEASHILYTDFDKLKIALSRDAVGNRNDQTLHMVWNIIEDFYIDSVTYTTSPGYRGYYQALYNKYFNSKDIVKGFYSKKFSELSWDSYLFHLCNIRNPQRNLNVLPKLKDIFNLLDLESISRLHSPELRFTLAFEVYDIIASVFQQQQQQQQQKQEANGDTEDESDILLLDGEGDIDGDVGATAIEYQDLSKSMQERLDKLFEKQKEFFRGELKKKTITSADSKSLNEIQQMDAEIRDVSYETHHNVKHNVRVVVIKNVTHELVKKGAMRSYGFYGGYENDVYMKGNEDWYLSKTQKSISDAVLTGRLLAKKLQLRNEERVTKSTRLKEGKIDRRLIHEIGLDNYQIFSKLNIKTYKPVHVHVSIDQSGSMSGDRFEKSMQLAAMFATASTMIKNLDVSVTLRGQGGDSPYVVYIFDSKRHGIRQILDVFPTCHAHGTTPEGLAFSAIEREIKKDAMGTESYFINICDGQPATSYKTQGHSGWQNYGGLPARKHCNQQMRKMEKNGTKFMAYYLTNENHYYDRGLENMRDCYGDRVVSINGIHEIDKISKTMNKKLLDDVYSS